MPISYTIFPDQLLTYIHYAGVVDADQVLRAARDHMADPNFSPKATELVDLREITEFDMSYRTMSNMVYRLGKLHEVHGPPAAKLLLADNDLAFSMASLFETIINAAKGPPVHVMRSETEALLRLGRPERRIAELLAAPSPRTRAQA